MASAHAMPRDDITRIEKTLFFEPPELRARLTRFSILILFASVIATCGLLSDSVASIIGAMIIAPLMTPIMGIVVALVMGNTGRVGRCAIIAGFGIGLAIGTGWLVTVLMPYGWDPLQSAQVMARTEPRMLDLVIALASGGAGAYALSRTDVADALPGVAIAISLVPPLNTAGILLAGHQGDLAKGALLLFATNFAAILLAGAVTFILTGLAEGVGRTPGELKSSIIATVILVGIISIPLAANSDDLWTDTRHEDDSREVVEQWLADTDWELIAVRVDGSDVQIVLGGSGELPPTGTVVTQLRSINGEDMHLSTRILDVRKEIIAGPLATPVP